jgi:hypothetical protein
MKVTALVTPAKAGVHFTAGELDSRFRGNDGTFDGVIMGLRPTPGNESRAEELRNKEWRYL